MVHKYDIDDLIYIKSDKKNRKAVVYYDVNKEKYVDINSNTILSDRNVREYNKKDIKIVGSLNQILSYYDVWLLLLDAHGNKRTKVTADVINDLMHIFERIESFNDLLIREVDYISHLVAEICISNLILSKKDNKTNNFDLVINGIDSCFLDKETENLRKLILNYIFIDTAINGITKRKLIIHKKNDMIDYKLLRIIKYLGIDINIKDIPNFKIEYNLEGINYYDSKGNKTIDDNLDKDEVEKIKKIVDKPRI